MNPVYVIYYIDGAHYTKEQRAILAEQTAKPKKANISL